MGFFSSLGEAFKGVGKQLAGSFTGGLSDLALGAVSGAIEKDSAYDQWQKQFDAQNSRQDWLMKNQASMQAAGARQAGMSLAAQNGVQQVGAVSSPSAASSGGSPAANGAALSQARSQRKVSDAQAKQLEEQAKAQNIQNQRDQYDLDRQKEMDDFVKSLNITHALKSDDNVSFEDSVTGLPRGLDRLQFNEQYERKFGRKPTHEEYGEYVGRLPEVSRVNKIVHISNFRQLEAYREFLASRGEISDLGYKEVHNNLLSLIESEQASDNKILKSLREMPLKQRELVVKQISELTSKIKLTDKQFEIASIEKEMKQLQKEHGLNFALPNLFENWSSMSWKERGISIMQLILLVSMSKLT